MGKRCLLGLILLFCIFSSAFVLQSKPAQAVGCSELGCDGLDPQIQGCYLDAQAGDNYTIFTSSWTNVGYYQRRYSAACDSYWTRVFSNIGHQTISGSIERAQPYLKEPEQLSDSSYIYTNMVGWWYQGTQHALCGEIVGVSSGGNCTLGLPQ